MEHTALLPKNDGTEQANDEVSPPTQVSSRRRIVKPLALGALVLLIGGAAIATTQSKHLFSSRSSSLARNDGDKGQAPPIVPSDADSSSFHPSTASNRFKITASNTYTASAGSAGVMYPFVKDLDGIVLDPHMKSTFKLETIDEATDIAALDKSSSYEVRWCLFKSAEQPTFEFYDSSDDKESDEEDESAECVYEETTSVLHESISFKFHALGNYQARAIIIKDGDRSQATLVARHILIRYVRREFRKLSVSDRERLIKAYKIIYTISMKEGKKKYGKNYKALNYLARAHAEGAANRRNDNIHNGMGFFVQHMLFTRELERTVQLIEPDLSMPYWDYTLDEYHLQEGIISTGYSSVYFDAEYFGRTLELSEWSWEAVDESGESLDDLSKIQSGSFKDQEVETNAWDAPVHNAYGIVRAPWNENPSAYVSRYISGTLEFPTCEYYFDFATKYTANLQYAVYGMQKNPHAPVHYNLGGTVGTYSLEKDLSSVIGSKNAKSFRFKVVTYMKWIYRAYLSEYPSYCSADTSRDECKVECTYLDLNSTDSVDQYFQYLDVLQSLDLTDEDKKKVVKAICEDLVYYTGEQLEATSPADPSFWSVHPAIERLMQYILLERRAVGKDMKANWRADNACPISTEKSTTVSCFDSIDIEYTSHQECCVGHLPTSTYFNDDGTTENTTLVEWTAKLDPSETLYSTSGYEMPYIYDNFEWSHCAKQGMDFHDISKYWD